MQLKLYLEVLKIDPCDDFALLKSTEILLELEEYDEVLGILDAAGDRAKEPSLYVVKLKCMTQKGESIDHLDVEIQNMLKKSLNAGDKKSSEYLKGLISS